MSYKTEGDTKNIYCVRKDGYDVVVEPANDPRETESANTITLAHRAKFTHDSLVYTNKLLKQILAHMVLKEWCSPPSIEMDSLKAAMDENYNISLDNQFIAEAIAEELGVM